MRITNAIIKETNHFSYKIALVYEDGSQNASPSVMFPHTASED